MSTSPRRTSKSDAIKVQATGPSAASAGWIATVIVTVAVIAEPGAAPERDIVSLSGRTEIAGTARIAGSATRPRPQQLRPAIRKTQVKTMTRGWSARRRKVMWQKCRGVSM